MTDVEQGIPGQLHESSHAETYADSVEDELKQMEAGIKKVRSEAASLRKQKPDPDGRFDYAPLREAMHELAHSTPLLRTSRNPVGGHNGETGRLETVVPLRDAPSPYDNPSTWPDEATAPDDIHYGETGLNRLAAERVKNAPSPKSKVYEDGSLKSAPVDNPAAIPVDSAEDVHAGKDGLNEPAAERVRHAGR